MDIWSLLKDAHQFLREGFSSKKTLKIFLIMTAKNIILDLCFNCDIF